MNVPLLVLDVRECAQNSCIIDENIDAILLRLLDDLDGSLSTRNEIAIGHLAGICKHLLFERVTAMLQIGCDYLDGVRICEIKLDNVQPVPMLFRQLLQIRGLLWCPYAGYDKGIRDRKDLQYRQQ